jgi:hypothetical protein
MILEKFPPMGDFLCAIALLVLGYIVGCRVKKGTVPLYRGTWSWRCIVDDPLCSKLENRGDAIEHSLDQGVNAYNAMLFIDDHATERGETLYEFDRS